MVQQTAAARQTMPPPPHDTATRAASKLRARRVAPAAVTRTGLGKFPGVAYVLKRKHAVTAAITVLSSCKISRHHMHAHVKVCTAVQPDVLLSCPRCSHVLRMDKLHCSDLCQESLKNAVSSSNMSNMTSAFSHLC